MTDHSVEDVNATLRARFHELDGQIKAAESELAELDKELDGIAETEAVIRAQRISIRDKKAAIVAGSDMVDKARERSRIAVYLDRKTGTADNH